MDAWLGSQRSREVTGYLRLSASYRFSLMVPHAHHTMAGRSHIIHTVGPVYSSKDKAEKAELLESCYKTSLEVAIENDIRHIVCWLSTFCVTPLRLRELLSRHSLRFLLASTHTPLLTRHALLLTRPGHSLNRRKGARWVGFWSCSKGVSYMEPVCLSSWNGWFSWSGATRIRKSMSGCIVSGSSFSNAQAIYNHRELIPEYFPLEEKPLPAVPTSVEPTSAEPTFVEPTPAEPTSVELISVKLTPAEPASVEPTSVEPVSVEPNA